MLVRSTRLHARVHLPMTPADMPDMVNLAYAGTSAVAAALLTCFVFIWWHQRKQTLWARQANRLRGERDQLTEQLNEAQNQIGLLKTALTARLPKATLVAAKAAAPVWFDIPTGDSVEHRVLPADGFAETMPFMPDSPQVH